jgi:hypothetical protein
MVQDLAVPARLANPLISRQELLASEPLHIPLALRQLHSFVAHDAMPQNFVAIHRVSFCFGFFLPKRSWGFLLKKENFSEKTTANLEILQIASPDFFWKKNGTKHKSEAQKKNA